MPASACVRHAGARLTSRAHRCAAVVVIAAAGCSLAIAPPAGAAQGCAAASRAPGSAPDVSLRRALRCLVNAERSRHGLRPLRASRRLGAAARSHARDMVRRGYFAHERPGSTFPGRLRAAGWVGAASAEAIGWGCGRLGVPRGMLDAWLASPGHRAIVLGRYRRAGIGLAVGSPGRLDCSGAGTWVLDVGR